ncbi:hypothetical protein [Arcticibacter sp. MXS-1]|uniref:hypothetical protein n=1 Tax=Arcticibacter sp. MXS-1 TaxID=3341726 RepID=UPI0035A889D9
MKKIRTAAVCVLVLLGGAFAQAQPVNRKAVVSRHNLVNTKIDSLESLTLGNGKFAFTADVTGLQTFPERYSRGVSLGTQSEWGWDSFKDTVGYKIEETLKDYDLNGRKISYCVPWSEPLRKRNASEWFRKSVHRLQLGNLGFDMLRKDGRAVTTADIKNIRQELNLWTGVLSSHFTIEGIPVDVTTIAHQDQDMVAVQVKSKLISEGRLKIRLRYPYPTAEFLDAGENWKNPEKHRSSILSSSSEGSVVQHQLEGITYFTSFKWSGASIGSGAVPHYYQITPDNKKDVFEFSCLFSAEEPSVQGQADYRAALNSSREAWNSFWMSGAAIDFAGSTDPRARELERRVVLSQYLTKVQCAGSFPPQETGLTYNSWFGKPHLEMHWWHAVHFALWNRVDLMEKSLSYYAKVADKAKLIAERQGFKGVRWQKMTDHEGNESPSSVGAFLIWQQPHFIYMAELAYRNKEDRAVLEKYKDLVFATADFMASFPTYDKEKDRYNLGKGLIPAQEVFKAEQTFNPTYEVAYWDWALRVAQKWRERLGMERNQEWDKVLNKLAPLPQLNGVYLATESAPDSYTTERWRTDHPAVLGALGMVPASSKLDKATMQRTFDTVWKTWVWDHTWGWDFPMTAMTAARLGNPSRALDALFMKVQTNTYLKNGHNYQDGRLRIYLPGNGGVLTAVAMMAGGWDGSTGANPGFPKNGKWKVRSEGFKKMP